MHTQLEHAHLLNELHIKGDPLILFNQNYRGCYDYTVQ